MRGLFYVFVVIVLASCTKQNVQLISGNQPPEDRTISEARKTNYINRLYITLLGKKPTEQQQIDALALLNTDPQNVEIRKSVVQSITKSPSYFDKIWQDARSDLLDGIDTAGIAQEYQYAVYNYNNSTGNTQIYWANVVAHLQPLLTMVPDLKSGINSMAKMHELAVNNSIYDEINMGTENFVVTVFQQFFFRYPTASELQESKNIVDGQSGVLFLQAGQSKNDFLNIIFSSRNYTEGQVLYVYQKYLFRLPTSAELSAMTQFFRANKDYTLLQQEILASDEYLFF